MSTQTPTPTDLLQLIIKYSKPNYTIIVVSINDYDTLINHVMMDIRILFKSISGGWNAVLTIDIGECSSINEFKSAIIHTILRTPIIISNEYDHTSQIIIRNNKEVVFDDDIKWDKIEF